LEWVADITPESPAEFIEMRGDSDMAGGTAHHARLSRCS